MTKQRWHLPKNIKTGELYFGYISKYRSGDYTMIENFVFDDTLTYVGARASASGITITFKGKNLNQELHSSMDLLDRIFDANRISNITIVNRKPLMLQGVFTFEKKGSTIHIDESIN